MSEIYLETELINRIFSKTAAIKNLELKFEDDRLKVKGKKIFSFEVDMKYRGIENDDLVFEFEELKMKSVFAKAGLALGGHKIVDIFAKGELPEFLKLKYPLLIFSMHHINISKGLKLTELVQVRDVKFDKGMRILIE